MTYPQWLDPTPLTRKFVAGFVDCLMREPFVQNRSQMMRVKLTWKQRMNELKAIQSQRQTANALRGGKITRAKALEDAARRGETMEERKRRQKNESQKRRRIQLRAAAGKPPYSAKGNSKRMHVA